MRPNLKLLDLWSKAAHKYHEALPGSPAEQYLQQRGLFEAADKFLLGYVDEPAPGHEERFKGMLSIPYITKTGVVSFKFRRLSDNGGHKYDQPAGQKQHLFNVNAILDAVKQVVLVEGELDAIAATMAGFPAVAVPGVNGWKPYFSRCFDGIGRVIIATDNDSKPDGSNPGQELAKKLIDVIPQAVRVSLPSGHDVNSTIQYYGAQHFASLVNAL